jgi:hypothetical protein
MAPNSGIRKAIKAYFSSNSLSPLSKILTLRFPASTLQPYQPELSFPPKSYFMTDKARYLLIFLFTRYFRINAKNFVSELTISFDAKGFMQLFFFDSLFMQS